MSDGVAFAPSSPAARATSNRLPFGRRFSLIMSSVAAEQYTFAVAVAVREETFLRVISFMYGALYHGFSHCEKNYYSVLAPGPLDLHRGLFVVGFARIGVEGIEREVIGICFEPVKRNKDLPGPDDFCNAQ